MIGHFLDKGVGNVGDGNAARGRGLDVNTVDADAAERNDLAIFKGIDDFLGDRNALGVDGIRGPGSGDEFRLIGRRLDDFGVDRIERFLFKRVTPAGDRETRALRRYNSEFRHFLLPIDFRSCYRRDVVTASRFRRSWAVFFAGQASLLEGKAEAGMAPRRYVPDAVQRPACVSAGFTLRPRPAAMRSPRRPAPARSRPDETAAAARRAAGSPLPTRTPAPGERTARHGSARSVRCRG